MLHDLYQNLENVIIYIHYHKEYKRQHTCNNSTINLNFRHCRLPLFVRFMTTCKLSAITYHANSYVQFCFSHEKNESTCKPITDYRYLTDHL